MNKVIRQVVSLAGSIAIASAAITVVAQPASAAFNCASGYFCLWADANGTGGMGRANDTLLHNVDYGSTSAQSKRSVDTKLWAGPSATGPSFCFKRGFSANFYNFPFPDGGTWDNRPTSFRNLTLNCQ